MIFGEEALQVLRVASQSLVPMSDGKGWKCENIEYLP